MPGKEGIAMFADGAAIGLAGFTAFTQGPRAGKFGKPTKSEKAAPGIAPCCRFLP
jgi:hypothetical protein